MLYTDDGLSNKFMIQVVKQILLRLQADKWKVRQKSV